VHNRVCRRLSSSFAIAAGVSLFYLARIMGTSVEQIDKTYGHLLPDSEEYLRGLLDSYRRRHYEERVCPGAQSERLSFTPSKA
jgi:hypothetical protein